MTAKTRIEDARREIEEIKSRLFAPSWDIGALHVNLRLQRLRRLLGVEKNIDTDLEEELSRHIIVSSIAAIQTYHRALIILIVDTGGAYVGRAAKMLHEKLAAKDALTWISEQPVTFGELAAHTVSCNNVGDIISSLETLLDIDIKQAAGNAVDPFLQRQGLEDPPRITPNVQELFKSLAEVFRLRHIFAHEAAPNFVVCLEDCDRMLSAVESWLKIVEAILWKTVYADKPLTQFEMNKHSNNDLHQARTQLARALRQSLALARSDGNRRWVRSNHFKWMRATIDWGRNSYGRMQGTMWPAIHGRSIARLVRSRAEQLEEWVRTQTGGVWQFRATVGPQPWQGPLESWPT